MTLEVHPFAPERQVGTVYEAEGSYVGIAFTDASKLPKALFGEYIGRGEVGEFLVVDVGGVAAFGRVLKVGTPVANSDALEHPRAGGRIPVQGRLQLLSTLRLDGTAVRGIAKYPKVGDLVYAASGKTIAAVLDMGLIDRNQAIPIGRLSVDESIEVNVPLARLFGRHLAIVGATGSGKSWTLGHLAESIAVRGGKLILIDATGEFHTLGDTARHLAFGSDDDEPTGAKVVGIPHYRMRESDRNAFLNPSSGTQLPKLREALRSLRLAHAIAGDPGAEAAHKGLLAVDGGINKVRRKIATFGSAVRKYGTVVEDPHAPFDIKLIGKQIQWECIWPTDRQDPSNFGDFDYTQIGYVSTLVSRVNDLIQTPEIMNVIDPQQATEDALGLIRTWVADTDSPVLRISLRNLTFANHLREIVVNIIGQELLASARRGSFRSTPLVAAIDEAHQFFDVEVGDEHSKSRLSAFDAIAKEGRKYGLTACVVTQRPGDLPAGVLSQVGMTIVHRLADGRDRQRIERAAAEIDHSATQLLPGLVPGEAILMGVDFPVPVSVRVQRPVHPPASDGPRYTNWGAAPATGSGDPTESRE